MSFLSRTPTLSRSKPLILTGVLGLLSPNSKDPVDGLLSFQKGLEDNGSYFLFLDPRIFGISSEVSLYTLGFSHLRRHSLEVQPRMWTEVDLDVLLPRYGSSSLLPFTSLSP